MKPTELIIIDGYLSNWLNASVQEMELYSVEATKYLNKSSSEFNRPYSNYSNQSVHQFLPKARQAVERFQQLSFVKSQIKKLKKFILYVLKDEELGYRFTGSYRDIDATYYNRMMDRFLRFLESNEMYEECALIFHHRDTIYAISQECFLP